MVKIIAEIGKNFRNKEEQGVFQMLENAKVLIQEAKKAGANVAKFQAHHVYDEVHPDSKLISPHFNKDRYEWVKENSFSEDFWFQIKEYCREVDIEFLCTPMSRGAAEIIEGFVDSWKVGSGDLTDFVLLDYIRDSGKPVIISSGMSTIEEVREAYNYLREKTKDVSILHCISQYPCPLEDLNLSTITYLKKQFPEAKIGFSDHSIEAMTGGMAVQLGAEIIEKHFTMDRGSFGPDHKCSLMPGEFAMMVRRIREIDSDRVMAIPREAMGVPTKFIDEKEMPFRKIFRKGLYAGADIKVGQIIHPDMLIALRPQGGARPASMYPEFVGKMSMQDYKKYEAI